MQNSEVQHLITRKLRARGLIALAGKLTFTHKGQAVALVVDQSIYRGHFVSVLDHGRKVCEFRMGGGDFDWDAMAASVIGVAERRLSSPPARVKDPERQLASDLRAMFANGTSSHLSIEPSPAMPGRLRVKLQELDLDPASVMQLCATLSRALATAGSAGLRDPDVAGDVAVA